MNVDQSKGGNQVLRLATYLSYNYSEVWLSELANSYGLVDRPAAESIPNH